MDDHLRNHGFLLGANGWRLSPAYDINPDPNGHGLKLNISESDNAQDLALVTDVAPWFRVKPTDASNIIRDVVSAVKTWRSEANELRISAHAQERMAGAFKV